MSGPGGLRRDAAVKNPLVCVSGAAVKVIAGAPGSLVGNDFDDDRSPFP